MFRRCLRLTVSIVGDTDRPRFEDPTRFRASVRRGMVAVAITAVIAVGVKQRQCRLETVQWMVLDVPPNVQIDHVPTSASSFLGLFLFLLG